MTSSSVPDVDDGDSVYVVTNSTGGEVDSAWQVQFEANERADALNAQQTGYGLVWSVFVAPFHPRK